MTIRVKQCCCGCGLDIGARILIWADLLAAGILTLNIITNGASERINDSYRGMWMLSAFIGAIKLVIGIIAVFGMKKKKPSYLRPYIVCNIIILIITALLVFVAIYDFDETVKFVQKWSTVKQKYNFDEDSTDTTKNRIYDEYELRPISVGVLVLIFIICTIINIVVQTYFIVVVYSYYKTLREGGNFTNVNGVEYFAPIEQIAPKNVVQNTHLPNNRPPPYFTTEIYPTQPVVILQAPPSYDEVAGPKAFLYPAVPSTK